MEKTKEYVTGNGVTYETAGNLSANSVNGISPEEFMPAAGVSSEDVLQALQIVQLYCRYNGISLNSFMKRVCSGESIGDVALDYNKRNRYQARAKHPVFHVRLRQLRIKRGLTQKELNGLISLCNGHECMYSPSVISHWENGRNLPSKEDMSALMDVLHCNLYELTDGIPF